MLGLHNLFRTPKVTQNRLGLCGFLNLAQRNPVIDIVQCYPLCPEPTDIAGTFPCSVPCANSRTEDRKKRGEDDKDVQSDLSRVEEFGV
jgi:hypothetical protein